MCNAIQPVNLISKNLKLEMYFNMRSPLVCCCLLHLMVFASYYKGSQSESLLEMYSIYSVETVRDDAETGSLPASRCDEEGLVRGPCRAGFPRWTWMDGTCQRFLYGGCRGNNNNFHSVEECRETCSGQEGRK